MDQPGENLIPISDEARDSGDERRNGLPGPAVIVAGVLCVCAGIVLWPMGNPGHTKADSLFEPAAASNLMQKTFAQRQPLQYYHAAIPGGLFNAPQLPAPQPKRLAPQPPVRTLPTLQRTPVAPINPFADWVYTGSVKRGSRILALLENTRTKEGQYVVSGDSFQDGQVESISEQVVTLREAGKRYTLPKSEAISVIALDKNAPYLANGDNGQPGAGLSPSAPGVPPAPPAQAQPQPNNEENADANSDQSTDNSDQ